MTPDLSVVVVILAGGDAPERCLTALSKQQDAGQMEIVVPYDEGFAQVEDLQRKYPHFRFVKLSGKRTFAELRSAGFQNSKGRIIALTEDQCIPDPDWCSNILRAQELPYAVVGGAVDKGFVFPGASDRSLNWAQYLCDYSRYANPVPEGPAEYLTDCNVSYKREALQSISQFEKDEFHETTVHWALMRKGEKLWLSPRIVVRQQRNNSWMQALQERYAFGRLFASTRVASAPLQQRLFYALLSVLLPFVLTFRIAMNVFSKRRYRFPFFRSLPWILLFNFFWAYGEFLGYCTAHPDPFLTPRRAIS